MLDLTPPAIRSGGIDDVTVVLAPMDRATEWLRGPVWLHGIGDHLVVTWPARPR
ncbi:hypothetical protein [Catellatospora paridis]|uniref:hypothetical protein n=1 Tax=Catellatospora paridis TaxID=1617086 RepID=UPI0012D3F946|nr:hypothetical protein [Catellatospora paridis]